MTKPSLRAIHTNLCALKEQGKMIIGILPHAIVPDELIHAANGVPLHFCLGSIEDQTQSAPYLPETTCGFQRASLGIFERREGLGFQIYNLVDAVISGTFCTGVQNTAMYLEHYFGKKQFRLVVPYWNEENTRKYFAGELYRLTTFLEHLCGSVFSNERLNESIRLYNDLRGLYREIDQYRTGDSPLL